MGDVKSSAVIKYSATKNPAGYSELATNTNLNSPPRDWLQGRFAKKEPWAPGQAKHHKQFSSFSMANSYIDLVGKVDVVTDAENIKKLLKMNYSDAPVSLILHRVGRTLLIDSMDVYKNLLFAKGQEWQWLKKFMSDTLNSSGSMALAPVSSLSRQDLEANIMMSKFLYHSLVESKDNQPESAFWDEKKVYPGVPDPLVSEEDDLSSTNKFERNVLWNFEDIRMLVGTDLPIFGAGTHPCVTLRLRDMKKPISVLTGIDYWLDQLMCTVPEVVMCYHLNGIVQRYEMVKTEDLPNLPDSSFSPELIRDVAQNILSFLKSNATKEGHTYWLFKDKDDDIVKLYDLTCVCQEYMQEADANPFTLPVAVLMYRAARNLLQRYNKSGINVINTVYRLLTHCLELLDEEKFPQVVGSAHYFLANLYVIRGSKDSLGPIDPISDVTKPRTNKVATAATNDDTTGAPSIDGSSFDQLDDDSFDSNDWYMGEQSNPVAKTNDDGSTIGGLDCVSCVSLDRLTASAKMHEGRDRAAPPLPSKAAKFIPHSTNMEDSWQSALEHVFKALECIKAFDEHVNKNCNENDTLKGQKSDVDRPSMADGRPIPLHYESLTTKQLPQISCLTSVESARSSLLPLAVRFPNATGWRLSLTLLLLTKAFNVYWLLSDCAFRLDNYGKSLRYLKLGFLCYEGAQKLISSASNANLPEFTVQRCKHILNSTLPQLVMLCGDLHVMLSKLKAAQINKHISDYNIHMYRDEKIADQAKKVVADSDPEHAWCTAISTSMEENLQVSQKCYESAIAFIRSQIASNALPEKNCGDNPNRKDDSADHILEQHLDTVVDVVILSKRLGNVKNALGIYFMNLSSALLAKNQDSEEAVLKRVEKFWHTSYVHFQEGIRIFNRINDKDNEALLNSNAGRLMRLCASFYAVQGQQVNADEEHYLKTAVEMYQRALECVNPGSNVNRVWENVAWELSSVYFTYAVQLQDRPPITAGSFEEVEKSIVDLMQKALRLVETLDSIDQSKHAVYLYRTASIHHKLASLYHLSYRSKDNVADRKLKHLRSLTELHYKKASEGFKECVMESPAEFIRVQIERVVLLEGSVEGVTSQTSKLKLYSQALDLILSCRAAFISLCRKFSTESSDAASTSNFEPGTISENGAVDHFVENPDSSILGGDEKIETLNNVENNCTKKRNTVDTPNKFHGEEGFTETCKSMCNLTIHRLRAITKSALFVCRSNSSKDKNFDHWKEIYAVSLRREPLDVNALPSHALKVLEEIFAIKQRDN